MKKKDNLINANSNESTEYKTLILLIVLIALVFGIFYFITTLITKKTSDNIFKNDLNATEIQYDEIIISDIFNKDGEFYVLLLSENDPYKDIFNSYISSIEDTKIYTVDLSSAFNKRYISDEYNYDKDDFKVKDTVLVKVNNNKVVDHYETKEDIIEKLKDLKN